MKMSDDIISDSNSFIEAFDHLHILNDTNVSEMIYNSHIPQVPNGATHDDLTCRMPQSAGDMDNSDDTESELESESDSDSDVIVVVDSSDDLSVVSLFSKSDLNTDSEEEPIDVDSNTNTIPETETETETDSESDTNGSPTGPIIMNNFESTPIKRKHIGYPNSQEKRQSCDVTPELDVPAVTTTTRSGRAVRQRLDHKFDYSSPEELSIDDTLDDPDFRDNDADDDTNEDDDDNDMDYCQEEEEEEQEEPVRKQRRLSLRSSCCSSSNASSTAATSAIIYMDLRQPVAIVSQEPTSDPSVEFDNELKTRLKKFLGLMPAQRRLYNPMADHEQQMDEDVHLPIPIQSSRLWATNNNNNNNNNCNSNSVQSKSTPRSLKTKAIASPMPSLLKTLGSEITPEMKMLLLDDIVQRANASCFESQTPEHIKEPLDLSGLPSEKERTQNCRQQHKKIPNLLQPCPGYYSFLDSLRSETPLNMCHPLAVSHRKRDFESSKTMLARTLFHALNHTVFHCGLRLSIAWKSVMNTPSRVLHRFDSSGQRVSRIILWQHIKQPGVLIKALIHEMCHAAAFVYHGETGHGDNCRKWAYRAKSLMPELPQIDDCTQNYKYTCLLCRGRSFGIVKFEDEEQYLRCYYCQFEVNVETCHIEDAHHHMSFTDQLVTPYKRFVRDNYTKCEESSHSSKMAALNIQYKDQLQQTTSN